MNNEFIKGIHEYLKAEWFDCTYYQPKGDKMRDDLAQSIIGDKIQRANDMGGVKQMGTFKLVGTIDSHEIIFEPIDKKRELKIIPLETIPGLEKSVGVMLMDYYDRMKKLEKITNYMEREGKQATLIIMTLGDIHSRYCQWLGGDIK